MRILTLSVLLFVDQPSQAGLREFCRNLLLSATAVPSPAADTASRLPSEREMQDFWKDLEQVWTTKLESIGYDNQSARLCFFTGQAKSPCGFEVTKKMGPIYLLVSRTTYIDRDWLLEAEKELGLQKDLSFFYILAHEYAHHATGRIELLQPVLSPPRFFTGRDRQALSVMNELTADALAGFILSQILGPTVIKENGIGFLEDCAFGVGDDKIHSSAMSHGLGSERRTWLRKGLRATDIRQTNAFRDPQLLGRLTPAAREWVERLPYF